MNFTILSLCLAAAQPLVQGYFTNLMRRKMLKAARLSSFVLVHGIEGRRRYKSELLKDGVFAQELKKRIDDIGIVKKVTVNYVTGTILFEYDCTEAEIDDIIDNINEKNDKVNEENLKKFDESNQSFFAKASKFIKSGAATASTVAGGEIASKAGSTIRQEFSTPHKTTIIAQSVKDYFSSLNSFVKSLFKNVADLSVIVGVFCLGWGAYKIFWKNEVPNGPQLTWWGYKIIEGGLN